MEEIYLYILRTVLAIMALVGVIWSGLRYLIKYHVFKTSHETREYADGKIANMLGRVHVLEAELYDLNIALQGHNERIGVLEKLSEDLSGFKERLIALEKMTQENVKKKRRY